MLDLKKSRNVSKSQEKNKSKGKFRNINLFDLNSYRAWKQQIFKTIDVLQTKEDIESQEDPPQHFLDGVETGPNRPNSWLSDYNYVDRENRSALISIKEICFTNKIVNFKTETVVGEKWKESL